MPAYPPSIDRVVEVSRRHFPAQTEQMQAALPVLLGPLLPAGSARWRRSLLTDGGFPFEITCSTAADGPRYTLEVGPGDTPPGARLDQALHLLAALGDAPDDDDETRGLLAGWQARGRLRFGAWLGARHGANGSSYKVYAEVPAEARTEVGGYLRARSGRPPALPGRVQQVQMVGWSPVGGDVELYARVHDLRPWELAALMSPVGLQELAPAVLAIFEELSGRPFGQRLPGPVFGYSYRLPAAGSGGAAFSFFSFCEALAHDDADVRRRLRGHWRRQGVCMDYYTELSGPTAGHPGPWNHHGLIGVTVTAGADPVTYVGLRPPEAA